MHAATSSRLPVPGIACSKVIHGLGNIARSVRITVRIGSNSNPENFVLIPSPHPQMTAFWLGTDTYPRQWLGAVQMSELQLLGTFPVADHVWEAYRVVCSN